MSRLLFKRILRKKTIHLLFVLSLVGILLALPAAAASLGNIHRQVKTDITYYARGSYDLLVRPPGAKHPLEDKMGIVPENYIGFGNGGISVEQWERIKNRKDIEIAAPVASLGYFTGINNDISIYPPEHEYNRYLMQFYTSDGINDYAIKPEYACFILKYPMAYQVDGNTFETDNEYLISHKDLLNECTDKKAAFLLPDTYHLLVAIDPEEEEKLTGVSFSDIDPDSPKMGLGAMFVRDSFPDAKAVPVIEVLDGKTSVKAKLRIDELELSRKDIQKFRERLGLSEPGDNDSYNISFINQWGTEKYDRLVDELLARKEKSRKEYDLDLSDFVKIYKQNEKGVYVNEEGKIGTVYDLPDSYPLEMGYFVEQNFADSTVFYRSGFLNYVTENGRLAVKKLGELNGVPIYREIEKHGMKTTEAYHDEDLRKKITFILDPVGTVKMGNKKEQLAASPLGIYQFAPVKYIGDGEHHGVTLEPTITPGSFVTPAAKGLTNIQSAAWIKGDKPIDAIRVKVAGIEGYTKAAAEKIEKVAKEIEAMGLEVTMIAGASPQKLKVDVEGVGLVEESWTTLGAAGTIVDEWNLTNVIIGVLFAFVALFYLINRMLFWEVDNRRDVLLFHQLGWKRKHIIGWFRQEMAVLLLLSASISLPGAWALQKWGRFGADFYLWFLIVLLAAAFILLVVLPVKFRGIVQERREFRAAKRKKAANSESLVRKNLSYYGKHIRPPFAQIGIVSLLSSFVYLSIGSTGEQTGITLLGEYINLQTDRISGFLIGTSYVLAVSTLIESILSLLKVREKELENFRLIGWKNRHIFRLYLKETAAWSALAAASGCAASAALYSAFYPIHWKGFLFLGANWAGFTLLLLAVSAFTIRWRLRSGSGSIAGKVLQEGKGKVDAGQSF